MLDQMRGPRIELIRCRPGLDWLSFLTDLECSRREIGRSAGARCDGVCTCILDLPSESCILSPQLAQLYHLVYLKLELAAIPDELR